MKPSVLFSPSSWRRKKRSPSEQIDTSVPPSPASSCFQYPTASPSKVSLLEGADTSFQPSSSSTLPIPPSYSDPRPSANGTPRRPPRPPNLDLHAPILKTSISYPLSPKSPRTPRHDVSAPPLSPSYSCPPRCVESQSFVDGGILKPKRSMPQLDGVWKGFLEEVDEDPQSFVAHSQPDTKMHFHHRSLPRRRGQLAESLNSPKSKSTHDLPMPASYRSLQHSPCRPKLQYAPPLPPIPSTPVSQIPKDSSDETDEAVDLTLSFPAPPPLFIRRKVPALPALKPRTESIARSPPSPAMHSSTSSHSSSDSTPVATPTTATPPKVAPLSILKKSPSPSVTSFPLSPSPSLPSPSHSDFSGPHSRSLRLIQSISHLPSSKSRPSEGRRMASFSELDSRTSSNTARPRCSSIKRPKPVIEHQYIAYVG